MNTGLTPSMRNVVSILSSFVAGILCLAVNQLIFSPGFPPPGEYYWMHLAAQNYTPFSCVLMSISGFLIAFGVGGNPFLIGFGALAILPVIALPDVCRGSHHLLPFELVFDLAYGGVYAIYCSPVIGGALLGWLINRCYKAETKI